MIQPDMHAFERAMTRLAVTLDLPGVRRASVSAIVEESRGLLLIRRAEHEGDPWSGHVGFPGGIEEPQDVDSVATALRETHEELGLQISRGRLLGALDDVQSPGLGRKQVVVRPFVFHVESVGDLHPNEEVESVHFLSLPMLLDGVGRGSFELSWKGGLFTMPCVDFEGLRLWGMTLQMVDDLLDRLDGRGVGMGRPCGSVTG